MLLAALAYRRREGAGINDQVEYLAADDDAKCGANGLPTGAPGAQEPGGVPDFAVEIRLTRGHQLAERWVVADRLGRKRVQGEEPPQQGRAFRLGDGPNCPQFQRMLEVCEIQRIVQDRGVGDFPRIARFSEFIAPRCHIDPLGVKTLRSCSSPASRFSMAAGMPPVCQRTTGCSAVAGRVHATSKVGIP